jgi:hypothetical protein
MYYLAIRQFVNTLKNLDAILGKAEAYAKERNFDVNNLVGMRLAPDMLPFAAQIRICCDGAKASAASLSGKEAPKHEDNEKTFEELRARIGKCLAFVESVKESDFAAMKPDTAIQVPGPGGKRLRANDYLYGRQIPNFYFHVAMAYALLRHAGVPVGKADYLGNLPFVEG